MMGYQIFRVNLSWLFVLFAGCVTSGSVMRTTPLLDKQGHRGCRGLMPENTIAAMVKALDLGVTTLEMDVVITADEKVVLSHEPFFNHEITTMPHGSFVTEEKEKSLNIFQMNYDQVQTYDVGVKPHPRFPLQQKMRAVKPLLSHLIDSVKAYCREKKIALPQFNIETKSMPGTDLVYHPAPARFVTLLMDVIKEKGMENYTIIQSFDFRTLQYVHRNYPSVKTAMLIEDDDKRTIEEQAAALGFLPSIYSPHFSLVTKELITWCHQKQIKVIPWTVNDAAEMKRLVLLGADGIISDYPDLFADIKQ